MYQSILVPFDNSDQAKNALKEALGIAKSCDAQITVLSIADLPDFSDPSFMMTAHMTGVVQSNGEGAADVQRQFYTLQEDNLVKDTAEIIGTFPNVKYCAKVGKPQIAIAELSESEHYDLIVMGCRGLGAFRGAVGSVSRAVVHSVNVPVLLVK